MTCSSSHYFPQFLSLENMQQHTKTATTCSLQAPCNNSLGILPRQPSHSFPTEVTADGATWPTAWHLCFSIEKQKHIETLMTMAGGCGHTLLSVQTWRDVCEPFVECDKCSWTGSLCDGRVTCTYNDPRAASWINKKTGGREVRSEYCEEYSYWRLLTMWGRPHWTVENKRIKQADFLK